MDTIPLLAALLSAFLHAAWNAAIKVQASPQAAMTAQMIAAACLSAIGLVFTGLPPLAALPWVLLATLLSLGAVLAMLRAYRAGGFGTVYPVMRAVGVLGVMGLAPLVLGERLGAFVIGGVALVAFALLLLTADSWRAGRIDAAAGVAPGFTPAALGWTLLGGSMVAGQVLCDAQGVRIGGDGFAYGFAVSVANAAAMAWVGRGLGSPWALVRDHARIAWPAAFASSASYLLILWVYARAPIAPAAALRDTSAIFAMVIAALVLKERFGPARLAALVIAIAGVALLRLG